MTEALILQARKAFHAALLGSIYKVDNGIPANADKSNPLSVNIATAIAHKLEAEVGSRLAAQRSGHQFETCVANFVREVFLSLPLMNVNSWSVYKVSGRKQNAIADFAQYAHLAALQAAANENPVLAAALGNDYAISPDVVVVRLPEEDSAFDASLIVTDTSLASGSDIRAGQGKLPILHASISTKWTLRSDRAQNARSEALNLIRNRKGRQPHIVVVTAEPLPSRLSSLALGTGDIDCVYHFALYELMEAVRDFSDQKAAALLNIMVQGKRLKDISDLPFDLLL